MSEFQTVQMGKAGVLSSVANLKAFMVQKMTQLPNALINIESVEYGYIGPGHGARGKKMWIYYDDDIAEMYETHSGNRTICLWCYMHAQKVSTGKSKALSGSKSSSNSTVRNSRVLMKSVPNLARSIRVSTVRMS